MGAQVPSAQVPSGGKPVSLHQLGGWAGCCWVPCDAAQARRAILHASSFKGRHGRPWPGGSVEWSIVW